MDESPSPDKVHQIMMDALVSYGDACTLPDLTPSCPFYAQVDSVPTCEEQCRSLAEQFGVVERPVREVAFKGLVMRGRALPRKVASGMSLFDAQQTYIEHRRLPPAAQSTSSLLLGLEAAIRALPLNAGRQRASKVLRIWDELMKRGVPADRVVRESIVPEVASRIGAVAGAPAVSAGDAWPPSVSDDMVKRLENLANQGWSDVLRAAIDAEASPKIALERAVRSCRRNTLGPYDRAGARLASAYLTQARKEPELLQDIGFAYAATPRFTNRVREWLCRLVSDDLEKLVEWQAPPASVFLELRPDEPETDEIARWVWDRFTQTRLEDWEGQSLLYEWRSHRDHPIDLPSRVWHERQTDVDRVASLALEKLTRSSGQAAPSRGLDPGEFVASAVRHLKSGRLDRAANIFSGLAELRPSNGDVLNNLGFCLIPTDPDRAVEVLQEASLYVRDQLVLSTANRVLALHLVGRDQDALRLAEETLSGSPSSEGSCYIWDHDHDGGEMQLVTVESPEVYLTSLAAHIRELG